MSKPPSSSPLDLFAPSSATKRQSANVTKEDLVSKLGMGEDEADEFLRLRMRFLEKPLVQWESVQPAPSEHFHKYEDLKEETDKAKIKQLLNKLVVVQLNGGLGTGMGIKGPKSVLNILQKSDQSNSTFLDCKVKQIEVLNQEYDCDVPLVLMNSFNTNDESKKIVQKYKDRGVSIYTCLQYKYPLMYRDTLSPVPKSKDEKDCWYPPGSGEVFRVLKRSGLLDKFMAEGKDYLFVTNVENLSATVDLKILSDFTNSNSQLDFLLEVTDRISTDSTGGLPIKYMDNRVHIMEYAQIPPDFVSEFGVSKFKFWNTNNIWVKLNVLQNKLDEKSLNMDFTVKYRNSNGRNVLQIETPASMSIHNFKNCNLIYVPRSRFKPIKTTSQLLQVQSELYEIDKGALVMNPKRIPATEPLIKLGEEFRDFDNYTKRFKSIPNLLELDHLTVSGDVNFGANVTLKGTVIIVADTGSRVDIPDGAILENKIMAGNLLILEH